MNEPKENYEFVSQQVDKLLQNNNNKTTYPTSYPTIEKKEKQSKSIDYFCTNCGSSIPKDANFCGYCGKKI